LDYEVWKSNHINDQTDFLSTIPEFDMEKNTPIEDDNNLEKHKDDW